MRISTNQVYQQGLNALLDQQSRLLETQLQLATGKKINSPSDDPTGAALVLNVKSFIETTEQYQRNSSFAESRLALEETTLSSMSEILQRARELAVQGNNDTYNADDRLAFAIEIREILDNLLALANTPDGQSSFLFSGSRSDQAPFSDNGAGNYSYNGDQGQRLVQISPTRQVAVGDPGDEIFMRIPNSPQDIFSTLYSLASDLEANNPNPSSIDELDAAMDNISRVVANVGARRNVIESQLSFNEGLVLQQELLRSNVEDVDFAEATTLFNLQLVSMQASQESFIQVQQLSLFNFL